VDAVAGLEVNNRQEVSYLPRELGDAKANELYTGAGEWVRDNCDAEDEESEAFEDMIVSGLGATETRIETEDNPEGKIVIERLDVLDEVRFDPKARKGNLSDMQWVMRVKEDIDAEEAEAMFPGYDRAQINAAWASIITEEGEIQHDTGEPDGYADEDANTASGFRTTKAVTIVQIEWYEKEVAYVILDPVTGEKKQVTKGQHSKLKERYAAMGIEFESVPYRKKVFYRAFVGAEVLDVKKAPCPFSFSIKFITGKCDRKKKTWYGVVRPCRDPQKWSNTWLAQVLHIINTNAKGGLMAEVEAFLNQRKAEQDWADPQAIIWLQPGGMDKIKERGFAQYPQGLDRLMNFAIDSIPQVTGINLDAIGLADRNQPGVLEHMRKQSMMTNLARYFNSLRRYRKEQGRLMLYMIMEYISDGRLMRLTGQEGAKYVPLLKQQKDAIEFDVVVDDAPSSPNMKERAWAAISAMAPYLAKAPLSPEIWVELMKYSPLPSGLVDRIGQSLQPQGPPQPTPEQQALAAKAQSDQAKTQADIAKTGAEIKKTEAEVEKIKVETAKNVVMALTPQQKGSEDAGRR
jgi:hypothetical protein